MKKSVITTIKKYLLITFGSILYAAGVALFLDPNQLASGGVSGIAIIIGSVVDVLPTGTWVIILNIPIMIAGVWKLGGKILLPTFYMKDILFSINHNPKFRQHANCKIYIRCTFKLSCYR